MAPRMRHFLKLQRWVVVIADLVEIRQAGEKPVKMVVRIGPR